MEYSAFLFAFVWCGFGLVADITDGIIIENCGSGSVDIREKAENRITCKHIDVDATVTWYIRRSDTSRYEVIAICTSFSCNYDRTGQFTAQRSPQESQLFYRQQNRTEDFRARIMCESVGQYLNGSSEWKTQASCDLNLISPAILSGCVVEEDRDKGTMKVSCHFEHAFSAKKEFTCTWYLTMSSDQLYASPSGTIIKEPYTSNGHLYQRGQCSLNISGQHWNDGDYSYSIDFYPGPERQSVPVRRSGLPNDPDTDDDSLPIAAIAGGAAAAVVVIIGVVVIVVVVARRRQRRKPAETPNTPPENDWNSRRAHLRANSPTTATPVGDNPPTSATPTGDNSSTTESSLSPAGDNSSTAVNNPPETGDISPANNYESLRTSEMGLRSVYSALAGPDYYNIGLAAGGTGASTGESTGNSRRAHLRANSPTTATPAGDNPPTSATPTGDNSSTTESSLSPAGNNSSTAVNNPPETGDSSPANDYESLRTSEMGLRSVYSALAGPDYYNIEFAAGSTGASTGESTGNSRQAHLRANSPTTATPTGDNSSTTESSLSPAGNNSSTAVNNPPETGDSSPANDYESLRTSEMGLRSVYSALAGPGYYNTGFAAGSTGASTGESTGPDGEASPIYEN